MSVQVPDVTIGIIALGVSDDTRSLRKIKTAIGTAIVRAISNCLRDAISLAMKIVPESIYGDYPASYESEALMQSFIDYITAVIRYHATGSRLLKDEYIIEQEWEASYAEYVNEMKKFTKPGAKSGFIEIIDNFIRSKLKSYLDEELGKDEAGSKLRFTVK